MSNDHPTPTQSAISIFKGRIERLMRDKKLSYLDALKESLKTESAEEYEARNARAVQEAIDQLESPEYLKRVSEIMADPDPVSREAKRSKFFEDNCAAIDMGALHRHVRDNNKRLEERGVIPRAFRSIEELPKNALALTDFLCPKCAESASTWSAYDEFFRYSLCSTCGHSETERIKQPTP